VYELLEILW